MQWPALRKLQKRSPRCGARWRNGVRPAKRSRSFRPWARCMTDISRWCGSRAGGQSAWWSRSSSTPPSSRRPRISPPIPAPSRQTLRRWLNRRSTSSGRRERVEVMYPKGFATRIVPEGPATAGLEDAFRPDFFTGVATVVAKLFPQTMPDIAVFGEKDYQQLKVVSRMARDLDLPLKVLGAPTVREADGLAMSSRNVYLSPDERAAAPVLYRVLRLCAGKIGKGRTIADDPRRRPRGDRTRRLCARLSGGAPRRDTGADPFGEGRAGAAAGCGEAREDEADR